MGYHVLTYGGGRYTSVAWYEGREDAARHANSIFMSGRWSGLPPKVKRGSK